MIGTLTIRADCSPTIGTGHVMRMIALAQAWKRHKGDVIIVGRFTVPWLLRRLEKECISYRQLKSPLKPTEDPDILISDIKFDAQQWVVLDGYHFGLDCQEAVRSAGYNLLVVDDYNHLPEYTCDLLLNQNIEAKKIPYQGNINTKLLGSDYILLRKEFIDAATRSAQRTFPPKADKILLTLGGADIASQLTSLLERLKDQRLHGCILRVLSGGVDETLWKKLLDNCPAKIEIISQVHDIENHMSWADYSITAGGSTCWELCALGVPFAVMETAENQRNNVKRLIEDTIAIDCLNKTLVEAIYSPEIRKNSSIRGKRLVDGHGAGRTVKALLSRTYTLTNIREEDCKAIYDIASASEVRQFFFSTDPVPWADHVRWYAKRIAKKDIPFFSINDAQGNIVGYIRFELDDNSYFLSIALKKNVRGKGIGSKLLKQATQRFFEQTPAAHCVKACIKMTNTASQKAFEKADFKKERNAEYKGTKTVIFCKNREPND